jgi:hypothetical protein
LFGIFQKRPLLNRDQAAGEERLMAKTLLKLQGNVRRPTGSAACGELIETIALKVNRSPATAIRKAIQGS